MNKKRTIKKNETIRLSILLAVCLLLLVATIIVACRAFSKDKPVADTTSPQYIELSIVEGTNLADAKTKLSGLGISFEVVSTSSRTPNKVEKIEYIGKVENGKIFVEVGTTVKLYSNEVGKDKIIYLTFDDGPTQDNTDYILDKLEEYGIQASFFVEGRDVAIYPEKMVRTFENGHIIACHSFDHTDNYIYASIDNFLEQIEQYENALRNALGEEKYVQVKKIIRFPGGTNTSYLNGKNASDYLDAVRGAGYIIYDWTALTNDCDDRYRNPGESDVDYFIRSLTESLKRAKANELDLIVLMHDKKPTRQALVQILDYLVSEGYYFDTIDNCPEYTLAEN